MTCYISSEPKMYDAYNTGKDLYAVIAASALNTTYDNCLEFWPEGTELDIDGQKVIAGHKTHKNPPGKERRSIGKVINLAATYGMGGGTAGARLGKSKEEGQKLLDNFFTGFPKVKEAIDQSKQFLIDNGYVEDFVGRRRRLNDIYLPKYEILLKTNPAVVDANFNPILGCTNRIIKDAKVIKWEKLVQEKIDASQRFQRERALAEGKLWTPNGEMSNVQYEKLAKEALKDGVIIKANTGRIAQATRQCFNARIQGSAASLTKMAMVDIFNDKQLKQWDAKLIITVHDEVLVECPEVYADLVEKRLPEIMIAAAKKVGDDVPQACDPYNVTRWYADEMSAQILDDFNALGKTLSHEDALIKIYDKYSIFPKDIIYNVITGKTEELIF